MVDHIDNDDEGRINEADFPRTWDYANKDIITEDEEIEQANMKKRENYKKYLMINVKFNKMKIKEFTGTEQVYYD